MPQLPPVPLRVPVLSGGVISHDWAVYLNAVAQAVNTVTSHGTFANNAAAIAGGVLVGQYYQTAAGDVLVVV